MSDTNIFIEKALTGRSKCKTCGLKIEKGEIRMGMEVPFRDKMTKKYFHVECFKIPKKFKREGKEGMDVDLIQDLDEMPEDIQERVRKHCEDNDSFAGGKKWRKKKKAKPKKPPKGLRKCDRNDWKKIQKIADRLKLECRNNDLKKMLTSQGLAKSGTKDVMVDKIADAYVKGSIPRCNLCNGLLKLYKFKYKCQGIYNDDGDHESCGNRIWVNELERKAWEDSEESTSLKSKLHEWGVDVDQISDASDHDDDEKIEKKWAADLLKAKRAQERKMAKRKREEESEESPAKKKRKVDSDDE